MFTSFCAFERFPYMIDVFLRVSLFLFSTCSAHMRTSTPPHTYKRARAYAHAKKEPERATLPSTERCSNHVDYFLRVLGSCVFVLFFKLPIPLRSQITPRPTRSFSLVHPLVIARGVAGMSGAFANLGSVCRCAYGTSIFVLVDRLSMCVQPAAERTSLFAARRHA